MNFDGCTIYLVNVNMLRKSLGIEMIKDSAKPIRDTNQDKKHWRRLLLS